MKSKALTGAPDALPAAGVPGPEALIGQDQGTGLGTAFANPELPSELFLRVLELLPPNEQALSGRLACKDAAQRLSEPRHRTVQCGQPLPEHAADGCWQQQLQERGRNMSLKLKAQLLSSAATSGCETNVRLAWGVLQPCLFPEMVSEPVTSEYPFAAYPELDDPGTAAAKAGHVGIVAWLVAHGCPLHRQRTLLAAAEYCSLSGLQEVWELLATPGCQGAAQQPLAQKKVACAAARSRDPDARAKVLWVLGKYGDQVPSEVRHLCIMQAAEAGSMDVARHLFLGIPVPSPAFIRSGTCLLAVALRKAELPLADWLVDKRGLELPGAGAGVRVKEVWEAAAYDGSVATLQWLRDRGVPPHKAAVAPAIQSGCLDAVRFLLDECGLPTKPIASILAVGSDSVELMAWLRQRASADSAPPGGLVWSPLLYAPAALCGNLAMVEWLVREARCPFDESTALLVLCAWPESKPGRGSDSGRSGGSSSGSSSSGGSSRSSAGKPGSGRELMRALQLLTDAGCPLDVQGWDTMLHVAKHGDMELVRWVVQQAGASRWPRDAMQHLILNWPEGGAPGACLCDAVRIVLAARGSSGNSRAAEEAARRGDVEVLRLLHEQGGLRLGRGAWVAAAEGGCEAVLEWLAAVGCRVGTDAALDPYVAAGCRGDRAVLSALRRLGVPWGYSKVLRAVVDLGGTAAVVRWMVENGAPWDGAAVADAVAGARRLGPGHEAAAVWLERYGAGRGRTGVGKAGLRGGGSKGGKGRR